jgi:hypothetical protein
MHSLLARNDVVAVLKATDRLAERVNELREAAQREAALATVGDQLPAGDSARRHDAR